MTYSRSQPLQPQSLRGEHIAHLIESAGPGGAERMVVELAHAQQALGAVTTVFIPRGREAWMAHQLRDAGVEVEHYDLDSPLSWRCVRTLTSAFRRRGITLAHSHEFTMAVNGAVAARGVGIPHVITMHGGRYYAAKVRRRVLMRGAVASSQAIVAVSEALGDALSSDLLLNRTRVLTISNGVRVDVVAAAPLRAELGIAAGDPLVLAVGNLYPVKGHAVLLEAMQHLPHDTHVVIAGRGHEEASLRARAAELGMSKRLHLLGLRDDISALLYAADVFVQPSLDEGLPLAVLEAMFASRPIVASDVGDVARAVGPEGALLVSPGDAAALGAAITLLIEKPFLASSLAQSAHSRATNHYGLARMVNRYAELYAGLLDARALAAPIASARTIAQRSMRANTSAKTGSD